MFDEFVVALDVERLQGFFQRGRRRIVERRQHAADIGYAVHDAPARRFFALLPGFSQGAGCRFVALLYPDRVGDLVEKQVEVVGVFFEKKRHEAVGIHLVRVLDGPWALGIGAVKLNDFQVVRLTLVDVALDFFHRHVQLESRFRFFRFGNLLPVLPHKHGVQLELGSHFKNGKPDLQAKADGSVELVRTSRSFGVYLHHLLRFGKQAAVGRPHVGIHEVAAGFGLKFRVIGHFEGAYCRKEWHIAPDFCRKLVVIRLQRFFLLLNTVFQRVGFHGFEITHVVAVLQRVGVVHVGHGADFPVEHALLHVARVHGEMDDVPVFGNIGIGAQGEGNQRVVVFQAQGEYVGGFGLHQRKAEVVGQKPAAKRLAYVFFGCGVAPAQFEAGGFACFAADAGSGLIAPAEHHF